jgi:hypothetical protein
MQVVIARKKCDTRGEGLPLRMRDRDARFTVLQEVIERKRRMLFEKQKRIQIIAVDNGFLNKVKTDYDKYNGYILQQKREQLEAFQLLDKYINELKAAGELSKHNMEDAEIEQKKLMREINAIKKNLDDYGKLNNIMEK